MANNVPVTPGTGLTFKTTDNAGVHTGHINVDALPALAAGTAAIGKLAANSGVDIGDVDVTSLPADPFGANADAASATGSISAKLRFMAVTGIPITGTVTIAGAVTNAGTFAVQNTAALPAGTNNIGDVDVLSVPTDPFGANADAASATGSLSAKMRGIATALGVTALDTGAGTGGSRTLRVMLDSSQLSGGEYETVAASATDQMLGATGAQGDYLDTLVLVVTTAATSAVSIKDGNGSAISVFPNSPGAGVGTYHVALGLTAINATTPGWKITTGAGVSIVATGNFT